MIVDWKYSTIVIPKPRKIMAQFNSLPVNRCYYEEIHYVKKIIAYYHSPIFKDYWPQGFYKINNFLMKNKKDILAKKIKCFDHSVVVCTLFINKENKNEVC